MSGLTVPDPEQQPTMGVEEVAELLGVGRSTAYEAVRRGDLPSFRLGRRIVIPTAAVRRLLALPERPAIFWRSPPE